MTLAEALYQIAKFLSEHNNTKIDRNLLMEDRQYQLDIITQAIAADDASIKPLAEKVAMIISQSTGAIKLSQRLDEQTIVHATGVNNASNEGKSNKTMLFSAIAVVMLLLVGLGVFFITDKNDTTITEQASASSEMVSPADKQLTRAQQQKAVEIAAYATFRMHGSNTVGEKLAPKLLEAFLKTEGAHAVKLLIGDVAVEKNIAAKIPGIERPVTVQIHAHGSSTGFNSLYTGDADLAMSSRKIKDAEVSKLQAAYGKLDDSGNEHVIGVDGLAVIVHPANPINKLTTEQIASLFSGNVTDWSALGGNAGPVHIYARDSNSGTWDSFKSMVLKKHKVTLSEQAKRLESSSELSSKVSEDKNAIGFIGLPYVLQAKALAVSDSKETQAFMPTSFTVATEDYPLSRRLYLYTPTVVADPMIREFVAFTLSEEGQNIVKEVGFISQNIASVKPRIEVDAPEEFKQLAQNAERLSLALRFKPGSSELDSKGKRDIDRLLSYFEKHQNKHVLLFGFTDSDGDENKNAELSKHRAAMISELFSVRGIIPDAVAGFGEAMPVASNDSSYGRNKNRRVEVWVN